jgi:N-acetylglucosaminyldiphosphoundecaprenol N-acetyl-beta-D-mannosaminyltransferase
MRIDLFGMWVESFDQSQVCKDILSSASESHPSLVVTPNVDHFLRWQRDLKFRDLYDKAEFRLIDGMPILLLARLLSKEPSERITGVDLSIEVIKGAAVSGIPLAIIGGSQQAMKEACDKVSKTYPALQIFFTSTPTSEELESSTYLDYLTAELGKRKEKIVLLCLGSPKQEQLYFDLLKSQSITGTYLAVGGTIDFLADLKKRAPGVIQRIGMEWFFRFIQEPRRLFRRYFISGLTFLPYLLKALAIPLMNRIRKTP